MRSPLLFLCSLWCVFLTNNALSENLKVGIIVPLTGEMAVFGKKALDGARIAIPEFEKRGVRFFVEDAGQVNSPQVLTAAQKLVSTDKVDLILSYVYEDQTAKILPYLSKSNIPVFSGSLCSEKILSYKNTTCGYPNTYEQLSSMRSIIREKKIKSIGFVGEESTFSDGCYEELTRVAQETGIELGPREIIPFGTLDFRSVFTKVLSRYKDAVIIAAVDPARTFTAMRIIKEQKYGGLRLAFTDYDEKYFKEFGKAIEGVLIPGFIDSNFDRDFVMKFRAANNKKAPDLYSALGYDILRYAVSSALNQKATSGDLDVEKLIKYNYEDPAISGFKYKNDRSVSLPTVVVEIGAGGVLR